MQGIQCMEYNAYHSKYRKQWKIALLKWMEYNALNCIKCIEYNADNSLRIIQCIEYIAWNEMHRINAWDTMYRIQCME